MLKPKVGDLVRLKPTEVYTVDECDNTFRTECGGGHWFRFGDIEEILPGPLGVGDRVMDGLTFLKGTILAIAEGEAWVQWDDKPKQVLSLSKLFRPA